MSQARPASAGGSADPFAPKRRGVVAGLAALAVIAALVGLGVGAVTIEIGEVAAVISRRLGFALGDSPSPTAEAVIVDIRLPRVLLGLLTGAALGVSGAVLQGALRNPLADPQLLGIGPGASLGGVIGAVAGGVQGAIAAGTAGGLLTALVVRRLGRGPELEPSRLILTGVALGAALSALVGFAVFVSDQSRVPPIEFWLLGGLSGSTWRALGTTVVIAGGGILALLGTGRVLDLLTLGAAEARHLGVDVEFTTTVLLMGVGGVVGASVGAVGVVGFVGLLVPHVLRRLAGPAHRTLLLGSAVGGGLLVVVADIAARTLARPTEVPVGLITAAVGGPFFLWLIRSTGRQT